MVLRRTPTITGDGEPAGPSPAQVADRGPWVDGRTVVLAELPPARRSFRSLFLHHYATLRALLENHPHPGVALVAFDAESGKLAGSLHLRAEVGAAKVAILGRHAQVDLPLGAHGELSLRHLAVLVQPLASEDADEVRFRVLDLRTRSAFFDELGRRLEAVTSEGPTFLAVGGYQLFLLPTEATPCWPDEAEDGWQCIPERVYLEEANAEPERWRQHRRRRRRGGSEKNGAKGEDGGEDADGGYRTVVQTSAGPRFAIGDLLDEDEHALGTVHVSCRGREQQIKIGARAAQQGLLLGRYDRCNAASVLSHERISRVHLLFVEIDGALHAIDTGSTNGSWIARGDEEQEALRVQRLDAALEIELGEDVATVRWSPS